MATAFDIAPLEEDRIDEAVALAGLVFHDPLRDEERDRYVRLLRGARRYGAHDGDALIGLTGAYPIELSIPGGALPCAGVAFVGVAPTHRRRGVLRSLMDVVLADALAAGQPLAALWAAESAIYGRYGFGASTRAVDLELRADRPLVFRVEPDDTPLRLVDWRDAPELLGPIHARRRARRPGMPARGPDWWRDIVLRPMIEPGDGVGPVRLALLGDAGYVAYRAGGREIRVIELAGDSPAAEAALWRWIASVDLVDRVRAPNRPVDDPLPRMLVEGDDAAAAQDLRDALWLRLLDVPASLRARSWAAEVDVVLELADEQVPGNAGRWRLSAAPRRATTCERTTDPAELALDVREIGAAYLGGVTLATLAAAGVVDERAPGAVDALDAALRVALAPHCPELF